jgi:hypothetical protein
MSYGAFSAVSRAGFHEIYSLLPFDTLIDTFMERLSDTP